MMKLISLDMSGSELDVHLRSIEPLSTSGLQFMWLY